VIPIETTIETLIGSGGWVGAIALVLFVGKQLLDAYLARRRDKREESTGDLAELGSAVGNASTVNAIMTKSIESLSAENDRLVKRNQHLEIQVSERDEQIDSLKSRLMNLSEQAANLAKEVTTYQELLRTKSHEVE
jgi:septal ring factor EnvC (AmiA/AmiB activator)